LAYIECKKEAGEDLVSPISGDMIGKVNESIRSHIKIKLYHENKLEAELESSRCAMEVGGNFEVLLSDKWRK